MKILFMIRDVFYEANPSLIDEVKLLGDVRFLYTDCGIDKEVILQEVEDVEIIVVAAVKIDKAVIDAAKKLKYIIKYGAGYDNIDVKYAKLKGIPVTFSPGQNAEGVADHAFGLMLAASRNIPLKDKELKSGHWELSMGSELYRKRLGIIGFGAIGKAIARRANGFSMDTIAYGNYKDLEAANQLNVRFVDLMELLQTADYIILSTSLTEKNRMMINKETLSLMKPSNYLINIARGGLVNERDLIEALKAGRIRGAALDVFAMEPPDNELCKLENVIATPHIGGATYESNERIAEVTIENMKRFIRGEELLHKIEI